MNYIKSTLYLICIFFIIYFTVFLTIDYQTFPGRHRMPFIIWTIDTIDLFIHEAGHFVFKIFGQIIGFMGGSLLQVIIPIAATIVFARTNLHSLIFTLYWTGQSLVNVSVYIGDAPFQQLRLISHFAIHDWHWLMIHYNLVDDIETIASVVNVIGILTCVAGICAGLYFMGNDVRHLFSDSLNMENNTVDDVSGKIHL
jgi:hypothetical protein